MTMEEKIEWRNLTPGQTTIVLAVHATALKTDDYDTLKRIFDLGSPTIVFGNDPEPYCRIDEDSADVMKILVAEYL